MYFGPSPVLRLPSRTEASKIVMVRTVEEALELQRAGTGQICMGEVRSRAPMRSIFENSLFEISRIDFDERSYSVQVLVHRALLWLETEPNGFTRPRWSRQRRPSAGSPD